MADYGQGGIPAPPPMHSGRIPSFRNNHGDNFQNRCAAEPPACVQNAMMTKDKKPFTYTPGGLDLSQIKTPSMARRLNRAQQEQQDQENPAYFRQPSINGGAPPPPPPPGPPPPPPLVINVANPPKALPEGVRPEIVIPENPIGMLRKTRSPYHWEAEQSDRQQQDVPKFVEKKVAPSQQAPQMQMRPQQPPPQQFYQQPPQASPQPGTPQYMQQNNKSPSTSPIWKPEPKYPQSPQQFAGNSPNHSPQNQIQRSPTNQTKEALQRQDSQFNLSPSPWGKESPFSNSSNTSSSKQPMSPNNDSRNSQSATPVSGGASPWRQDTRNSPMSPNNQDYRTTPIQVDVRGSPMNPQSPLSSSQSMRSPGQSPYAEQQRNTTPIYNNVPQQRQPETNGNVCQPEWRQPQQQSPVAQQNRGSQMNNNMQSPGLRYVHPPANFQASNSPQSNDNDSEVRYQSHMTIPVTPRKKGQNEPMENTSENLPWVRSDNAINKTAPTPPWCQRAAESRRSVPADDHAGGNSPTQQWGQRPADNRRSAPRDSPSVSQAGAVQPPWLQQENRGYETLPRSQSGKVPPSPCIPAQIIQHVSGIDGPGRVVPIQMEMMKNEMRPNNQGGPNVRMNQQGGPNRGQQPQLRIIIDMNQQPGKGGPAQGQGNQQPQQHVMRVVQPHLVRLDGGSMMSPPTQAPQGAQTPRTRIIPIQMEPSSPVVTSPTPSKN